MNKNINVSEISANLAETNEMISFIERMHKEGSEHICPYFVINKERMVTIKRGMNNQAELEFTPLYPYNFDYNTAKWITDNIKLVNGLGNPIKLEIVKDIDYYRLLKKHLEGALSGVA